MKNFLITLLISCCLFPHASKAQTNNVELARVAYISQKVKLTSEQAQLFWPLYNEMQDKKAAIKSQIKKLSLENLSEKTTETEILNDIKKLNLLRQKEVEIEKEFSEKCLKVISPKQFAEFYQAEREFKLLLIKKLGENQ